MSTNIRKCVKELNKKENPDILLPQYIKEYMVLQNKYAKIEMMLEYYLFYETVTDGINPYLDMVKETVDKLNDKINLYLTGKMTDAEKEKMAEEFLLIRKEIVEKMEILTSYVDCFVVYEYILNRVQYRFEDMEMMPDDSIFARDLVNFIFSSKDNAAISDNVRFAVGQLPVRMARSRYFGLIKDSISIYRGSDISSLEGFLYMFRTNAMLYNNPNKEKYFTEFIPVLKELETLDFENITKELYDIYSEKIRVNATKLKDLADLYMQLGKLINEMYAIMVSDKYADGEDEIKGFSDLISGVYGAFGKESDDDLADSIGEQFVNIEGLQERVYENITTAGSALEGIEDSFEKEINELGLKVEFEKLDNLFLLSSNSVFAELEEQTSGKVSEEMAEKEAAKLIAECKEFFEGKSRMLRRAVMANTLEKMPVFFTSAQEVADYITDSLSHCDDEAEKYAAKQLLLDIMR